MARPFILPVASVPPGRPGQFPVALETSTETPGPMVEEIETFRM